MNRNGTQVYSYRLTPQQEARKKKAQSIQKSHAALVIQRRYREYQAKILKEKKAKSFAVIRGYIYLLFFY